VSDPPDNVVSVFESRRPYVPRLAFSTLGAVSGSGHVSRTRLHQQPDDVLCWIQRRFWRRSKTAHRARATAPAVQACAASLSIATIHCAGLWAYIVVQHRPGYGGLRQTCCANLHVIARAFGHSTPRFRTARVRTSTGGGRARPSRAHTEACCFRGRPVLANPGPSGKRTLLGTSLTGLPRFAHDCDLCPVGVASDRSTIRLILHCNRWQWAPGTWALAFSFDKFPVGTWHRQSPAALFGVDWVHFFDLLTRVRSLFAEALCRLTRPFHGHGVHARNRRSAPFPVARPLLCRSEGLLCRD